MCPFSENMGYKNKKSPELTFAKTGDFLLGTYFTAPLFKQDSEYIQQDTLSVRPSLPR